MKWSFIILSVLVSLNGQSDQIFVGTRPLSMGGAFIAVADDANAITWNSAGLPGLRRTEFTSTYADLYAMNINQSYFGFVRPFSDRIALGIDWSNLGFEDSELMYSENKLNFALGIQAHRKFSFGLTLKYLMRDMQLDGTSYGKSSGIGYDAGIIYQPLKTNLMIAGELLGHKTVNGLEMNFMQAVQAFKIVNKKIKIKKIINVMQ